MTITFRDQKGTSLTYEEMDENFRDLRFDTTLDRVIENGNTSNRSITVGDILVTGNIQIDGNLLTLENVQSNVLNTITLTTEDFTTINLTSENIETNNFISISFSSENIESDSLSSNAITTINLVSENIEINTLSSNTITTINLVSENIEINTLSSNTITANIFTNFIGTNQSLSNDGYQKFPGGLIVQWGNFLSPSSGGQATVTFPIPFPSICTSVQVTKRDDGSTGGFGTNPGLRAAPTTTQVNFSCQNSTINYWIAIGF
jgi:hypothetical protein